MAISEVDPASAEAVGRALLAHLRATTPWQQVRYAKAPTRIFGGNQSFVYGLALEGAPELRGPLILRILRPFLPYESVFREAAVQSVLGELRYPVPAVGHACSDPAVLGGAFQLMERLGGKPMLGADADSHGTMGLRQVLGDFRGFVFGRWPYLLAELQHRLHSLPVDELRTGLEKCGLDPSTLSFARSLDRLEERRRRVGAQGLAQLCGWLREHQGVLDRRPLVLCHGDFFPNQILVEGDRVTGVIDWSDVCFAPAELDVVEAKLGIETLPVPLGAIAVAACLREAGHEVQVVDAPALDINES